MMERVFTVKNKLGMHARPASLFVQTSAKFRCDVKVSKLGGTDDAVVNGKSVMGLMMLAAACGERLRVTLDGPDEDKALAAIEALFKRNFDEE